MNNQLSNLTYLPEACEAHGTGLAVVQKVPICIDLFQDRVSERLDFFFALTLIDVVGAMCVRCTVHLPAFCQGPELLCSPLSTPADTFLHTHTHTEQREEKGPKKN